MMYRIEYWLPKQELNLVEVLENVFHLYMYVCSYPAAVVYLSKHMQYTMLDGEW